MRRLIAGSTVLVLTTLFATPLDATSDEIRIVRGTLYQRTDLPGDLEVRGTSGVTIGATLFSRYAALPWELCFLGPCLPGDLLDLHAGYGAFILTGTGQLTLRGRTYSLWAGGEANANFRFDGAVVLPEFTDTGMAEVSAPFDFAGALQVQSRHEPGGEVFELYGSGVATVTLVHHPFRAGWVVTSVRYEFVPRGTALPQ